MRVTMVQTFHVTRALSRLSDRPAPCSTGRGGISTGPSRDQNYAGITSSARRDSGGALDSQRLRAAAVRPVPTASFSSSTCRLGRCRQFRKPWLVAARHGRCLGRGWPAHREKTLSSRESPEPGGDPPLRFLRPCSTRRPRGAGFRANWLCSPGRALTTSIGRNGAA